jgi:hypothetical protein
MSYKPRSFRPQAESLETRDAPALAFSANVIVAPKIAKEVVKVVQPMKVINQVSQAQSANANAGDDGLKGLRPNHNETLVRRRRGNRKR